MTDTRAISRTPWSIYSVSVKKGVLNTEGVFSIPSPFVSHIREGINRLEERANVSSVGGSPFKQGFKALAELFTLFGQFVFDAGWNFVVLRSRY